MGELKGDFHSNDIIHHLGLGSVGFSWVGGWVWC